MMITLLIYVVGYVAAVIMSCTTIKILNEEVTIGDFVKTLGISLLSWIWFFIALYILCDEEDWLDHKLF